MSAQAQPGVHCAGLNTTVLPNASAGAIFHAGIAIGKFHGVISPTTPIGSRVISTSTPGRTDGSFSPGEAQRFAGEELEDVPGADGFADALRQRLAFFAREQPADFVLARQDVRCRPCRGCWRDPGSSRPTRRGTPVFAAAIAAFVPAPRRPARTRR